MCVSVLGAKGQSPPRTGVKENRKKLLVGSLVQKRTASLLGFFEQISSSILYHILYLISLYSRFTEELFASPREVIRRAIVVAKAISVKLLITFSDVSAIQLITISLQCWNLAEELQQNLCIRSLFHTSAAIYYKC
jgi:hypothetical protein